MKSNEKDVWVGVDWGTQQHTVCVVDGQGEAQETFRMAHTPEGFQTLRERLARYPVAGVGLESSRSGVLWALLDAGHVVYAVNPSVSAQWRKGYTAGGAKDDARDAYVLADGVRTKHAHLRAFRPEDEATLELQLWCEDESRFIRERTRLVQQLQDALRAYFPGVLSWFEGWVCPTAWAFIVRFPTPEAVVQATPKKLYGFLRQHRLGLTPRWQERIAQRAELARWVCPAAVIRSKSQLAVTLAKTLHTLAVQLETYRQRIEALFAAHPDHALFASLPGAGEKLGPRLLSLVGSDRQALPSAQVLQQLCGSAPVTEKSGNSRDVVMRRACRKDARNTLHLFALCSLRSCAWARAFYQRARNRGDGYALALRKLAHKGLKIIFRMWQDRTPYNDAQYQLALVRAKSPLAYDLHLLPAGG